MVAEPYHSHDDIRRRPYYLGLIDENNGSLKNGSPDKQFRVELGSQVRFRILRGGPVSNRALLIVNRGRDDTEVIDFLRGRDGESIETDMRNEGSYYKQFYTVSLPYPKGPCKRKSDRLLVGAASIDDGVFTDAEVDDDEIDRKILYLGSELEKNYLEKLSPIPDKLNLEWVINFPFAGTFFIQFEYIDENTGNLNYTEPFYINVEPLLTLRGEPYRPKELRILTVISRCMGPLGSHWEGVYDNASQLGFNAIHFAPI
jgi:hypothetical protein